MYTTLKTTIITILFLSGLNLVAQQRYTCENGTVRFASEASLETIKASSEGLKGILDPDTDRFAFRVFIRTFTGFNSPLQQEHFNENYLESANFENAVFEGRIVDQLDYEKPGEYPIRAKGIMSIHGVRNEEIIPCTVEVKREGLLITAHFSELGK